MIVFKAILKIYKNFFFSFKVFLYSIFEQDTKYPKHLLQFEKKLSNYFKTEYSLTFSNGTTAAYSLFNAVGIKKDSKVLIQKISFPTIITILLNLNCKLTFLDINQNLQIELPNDEIIKNSDYIIITHLYGFTQDLSILEKIKSINPKIKIIEDLSHAQGALIGDKFAGTFGQASFSSMQGNKAISAGEGGFVITNSKLIYQKMIQLHHTNRTINERNKSNGLLGKGRMHPLGIPKAEYTLHKLEIRNNLILKKFLIFKNYFKNSENIIFPEFNETNIPGGFHYGLPFFIKDNELLLEKISKKFKIVKYNWPALDRMKEYQSYENFNKIIYDEIKDVNYYDYCNFRKSLYFLDLKSIISTSDFKIKKILSNDF